MESKIAVAFAAGLLSFVTPCVLPLVPGYLAAVSRTRRGGGRRVVIASLPFIAGFTVVFVALGALAGVAGGRSPTIATSSSRSQASSSWRSASRSWGCSRFPSSSAWRLLDCWTPRAGAVERAARGAFGLCAAPCIGPVLASILALASESSRRPGLAAPPRLLRGPRRPLRSRRDRVRPCGVRISLATRSVRGAQDRERRAARRPRAALLRPLLVVERRVQPCVRVLRHWRLGALRYSHGHERREGSALDLGEEVGDVDASMGRRAYGWRRRAALASWRSNPGRLPRPAWCQATATWTRPW